MCQRLTNKQKILKNLFALQRFGIKPGLERTLSILNKIGNPHKQYSSIHIAGTNGKGSVSSLIASILMEAGFKVGLYTSPHVFEFNERIRINKEPISDNDLCNYASEIMEIGKKISATFFEITTAIAFKYFAENSVDIAVIEAGMGGRFDSTNVITPELSIITNVDIDHQEYLGNTLEKIAEEKAGIIKPNIPVLLPYLPADLLDIFVNKAHIESAKTIQAALDSVFLKKLNNDLSSTIDLVYRNRKLRNVNLPISGKQQINNTKLVIAAVEALTTKYDIPDIAVKNGIENTKTNCGLRFRIEQIETTRPIFVDVSHNPVAIMNLVETIGNSIYQGVKWQFIFGAMADKNIREMLKLLKPITSNLILTQASISRSAISTNLAEIAGSLGFDNYTTTENVSQAVDILHSNNKPSICLGSFYVVEEFMKAYFR